MAAFDISYTSNRAGEGLGAAALARGPRRGLAASTCTGWWSGSWVGLRLIWAITLPTGVMAEWAELVGRLVELENLSQHNQLPDHQHHLYYLSNSTVAPPS